MGEFNSVLTQSRNGVKTITLNRPNKRNALNPQLIAELTEALHEAESCDCGVVILTGAGPAFCAGLDIEHLALIDAKTADAKTAEHRIDFENMAHVLRTLYEFPKPIIAAVNGPAIAGGMALATITDFVLAVPTAKFGYTEVRVGSVPAIVASFLLRQVGELRARELLLSGRLIKAHEALSLGLITQIVAPEELLPMANALAHNLLLNSPQAMRAVKQLLAKHASRWLDEEIEDAIEINAEQSSTEDFKEGIAAFLAHRRPVWPSRPVKG